MFSWKRKKPKKEKIMRGLATRKCLSTFFITLSSVKYGKARGSVPHLILNDCKRLFDSKAIIISKDTDMFQNYRYYIGINHKKIDWFASSRIAGTKLPESWGKHMKIDNTKSWLNICRTLFDYEEHPLFWNTSKKKCLELFESHKRSESTLKFFLHLIKYGHLGQVCMDPFLIRRGNEWNSTIRRMFTDFHSLSSENQLQIQDIANKIQSTEGSIVQEFTVVSRDYGSHIKILP